MKTNFFTLLTLLLIALPVLAIGQVSVEEFKKMNSYERGQVIRQAPTGQKEQLKKIDLHLNLLERYGGEAGLKAAREVRATSARGLGGIGAIFGFYDQIWDAYSGSVLVANEKAGMSNEQLAAAQKKLQNEREDVFKHLAIVDSLVFNMAASPKALDLEKEAEKLCDDWGKKFGLDGVSPHQNITKDEMMEVKKQMDQIFEEMKQLPKLTHGQAQKEYDAFPEETMHIGGI